MGTHGHTCRHKTAKEPWQASCAVASSWKTPAFPSQAKAVLPLRPRNQQDASWGEKNVRKDLTQSNGSVGPKANPQTKEKHKTFSWKLSHRLLSDRRGSLEFAWGTNWKRPPHWAVNTTHVVAGISHQLPPRILPPCSLGLPVPGPILLTAKSTDAKHAPRSVRATPQPGTRTRFPVTSGLGTGPLQIRVATGRLTSGLTTLGWCIFPFQEADTFLRTHCSHKEKQKKKTVCNLS